MTSKKLNIQIDSNFIRPITDDQIPDELKVLGVNAFNEKEFEKGVLLQVDLQLAEYELDQIEYAIGVDDKTSSNSSVDDTNEKSLKRKNKIAESYKQKKAKLASKIDDYKSYLENTNQDNNRLTSGQSKIQNNEELVKLGEITPFTTQMENHQSITSVFFFL
jgi:hypothetical protein